MGCSGVDHLTSDAGVPGSISGPAIYPFCIFIVFVNSSHPYFRGIHHWLDFEIIAMHKSLRVFLQSISSFCIMFVVYDLGFYGLSQKDSSDNHF